MTLQEVKLLNAFNAWATNLVFDAVAAMPEEQYVQNMHSSHGSIHGTLVHLVGTELLWAARWTGAPAGKTLSPADVRGSEELYAIWQKAGLDIARFVGTITEKKLQSPFTVVISKGEQHTQLFWQIILHLVDHSTYHRGQIAGMMRQLGVTPPSTTMISFFRETAKLPAQR